MSEPSQYKEQLHRAIHRISSHPPPDYFESNNEIPAIEESDPKETLRFTIIILALITIFAGLIILAIAWRVGCLQLWR